jgi:hypothetical protein
VQPWPYRSTCTATLRGSHSARHARHAPKLLLLLPLLLLLLLPLLRGCATGVQLLEVVRCSSQGVEMAQQPPLMLAAIESENRMLGAQQRSAAAHPPFHRRWFCLNSHDRRPPLLLPLPVATAGAPAVAAAAALLCFCSCCRRIAL